MEKAPNKAFFLDRDGTINVDYGYIGRPEDIELLPGAADAIRSMNQAGYLVIVVSNQSGVARGYYDFSVIEQVNGRLNELLREYGAHIDAFYSCPHLKDGAVPEFAIECECRKPKPGLFIRAIRDFGLRSALCYACGDKIRDVEALPQLGVPEEHLGVLTENGRFSHYRSLDEFTRAVLQK